MKMVMVMVMLTIHVVFIPTECMYEWMIMVFNLYELLWIIKMDFINKIIMIIIIVIIKSWWINVKFWIFFSMWKCFISLDLVVVVVVVDFGFFFVFPFLNSMKTTTTTTKNWNLIFNYESITMMYWWWWLWLIIFDWFWYIGKKKKNEIPMFQISTTTDEFQKNNNRILVFQISKLKVFIFFP